jgi:NAD+ kinase
LAGAYTVEERMMLQVSIKRGARTIKKFTALNDIVINRGVISRLISLSVSSGRDLINNYIADGLIIATPTGSTAYSLSAGGPVLHPGVEAIIINPICPHSLTERPVILPPDKGLTISLPEPERKAVLTLDGQVTHPLSGRDRVQVSRAGSRAKLIVIKGYSFYRMLGNKLHWGTRKGKGAL